jgi:hypothetical protein
MILKHKYKFSYHSYFFMPGIGLIYMRTFHCENCGHVVIHSDGHTHKMPPECEIKSKEQQFKDNYKQW